jgi:hypothetical protein
MNNVFCLMLAGGLFLVPSSQVHGRPSDGRMTLPALNDDDVRIEFVTGNPPWKELFDWVAIVSGKPVLQSFELPGRCPFVPPKGARYTIHEIHGLLNRTLEDRGFALVRWNDCWHLLSTEAVAAPR